MATRKSRHIKAAPQAKSTGDDRQLTQRGILRKLPVGFRRREVRKR